MNYTINSEHIKVTISTKGAELQSIKDSHNNYEYLWQGDSKFWSGRAPILFPIVGGLKNQEYLLQAQKYSMPNHGVARINQFSVKQIAENEVCFTLTDNEETRKMYPFSFMLEVTYRIISNKILITHRITNTDTKIMPFAFGLHPAFNLDDTLENTMIEFNDEPLISTLDTEEGFFVKKTKDYGMKILKFTPSSFDQNNTIVFDNLQSRSAYLHFKNSERAVKMIWNDDLPILAIWSKAGAPYVCIEPWCGLADNLSDTINELSQKVGMISLKPQNMKEISFSIEVF